MNATWGGVLLVIAGCGRLGFADAGADAGAAAADADLRAPDAAMLGPFAPPVSLGLVGAGAKDDPTLTADLLEIIYDGGAGDLYGASRVSPAMPFPPATILVALSDPTFDEDAPVLSADGLRITFASDRAGGAGGLDLYEATRPSRTSPWSAPTRIAELASSADDNKLAIADDGLHAVMASTRSGRSGLYRTTRTDRTAPWQPPVMATELVTAADYDDDPFLTPDGLAVYFTSDRGGDTTVWSATRPGLELPFAPPRAVEGISVDTRAETDGWVTPDQRTLVFTVGGGDGRDVFITTR